MIAPPAVMLGRLRDDRKVERVARHHAAFDGMREVAVEKGPAVGLARHRNEIDAPKVEEIGDRRAADRSGRVVQRHVAGDHEAIELQIHRERVAGYREPVARPQRTLPSAFEQEAIVVKVDALCAQVENRLGWRRGGLRRRRRARCRRCAAPAAAHARISISVASAAGSAIRGTVATLFRPRVSSPIEQ